MTRDGGYFLTSSRLGFRYWTETDEPLALGLWGDPQVTRMLGGPFTEEQVRRRLAHEIFNQKQAGIQYWPLFFLSTGEHVGCCGLRPYKPGIPELGFHLRRAFWGQGLAQEAAAAVIRYGLCRSHVDAIFAGHHPENVASQKVLLSLGFKFIGEEFYPASGTMHPSYLLEP